MSVVNGVPLSSSVTPMEISMKRILVPTQSPADWKRLLAKPDLHWKPGRSAMSAASSWEAANGLPEEIQAALNSGPSELQNLDLVIAIPEWEVPLPGGATTSHTDVLAVARNAPELVILAIEAKVAEPFGPTIREKRTEASDLPTVSCPDEDSPVFRKILQHLNF